MRFMSDRRPVIERYTQNIMDLPIIIIEESETESDNESGMEFDEMEFSDSEPTVIVIPQEAPAREPEEFEFEIIFEPERYIQEDAPPEDAFETESFGTADVCGDEMEEEEVDDSESDSKADSDYYCSQK